ncbi:MAG: glutamate 5-kinase [Candidatus Omnitrophota bacterium]
MKLSEKSYNRIVVKIGSSLFYGADKRVDFGLLDRLCSDIAFLFGSKKEVVIVTSGAIALGMEALRLKARPKDLASLQAAAAIGQNDLMDVYRGIFRKKGMQCGQVLLTWDDFANRTRYLIARNTLVKLLTLGVVPVINENDAVSIDEIKFGDNDQLSALVANIVGADLLVILSDVDGLWDKDKKTIRLVTGITDEIKGFATTTQRSTSVGGMITKITAAKITTDAGIPCVIANGRAKNIIRTLAGDTGACGTMFVPKQAFLNHKQRWLAHSTKPKGSIAVDDGAKRALMNRKSLLPVGVTAVLGDFKAGDVVKIVDANGNEFARGKIKLESRDLRAVMGDHLGREAIHCDNIVIF